MTEREKNDNDVHRGSAAGRKGPPSTKKRALLAKLGRAIRSHNAAAKMKRTKRRGANR